MSEKNSSRRNVALGSPTLHVVAENIPLAFYRAMKAVNDHGLEIRTQYDRKNKDGIFIDPPSKDAKVLVEISNPFNQPRFPPLSYCELGKYIAEIMGVKDHLVVPLDRLREGIEKGKIDTKWPYTYHQRLCAYPSQNGSIDQIETILDRLAKDPVTRRAVASTAIPEIDPFLKEDLPCLREVHLRCTKDENQIYLHMDTKWRSRDLYKAWHDNVIGLTFFQDDLARRLGEKTGKKVKVGSYTDYSSSLHIYGQDYTEKGADKFFENFSDEKSIIKRSWSSEKARDKLIVPQLEDLLKEDYWKFPSSTKEYITRLITNLKTGKYLP